MSILMDVKTHYLQYILPYQVIWCSLLRFNNFVVLKVEICFAVYWPEKHRKRKTVSIYLFFIVLLPDWALCYTSTFFLKLLFIKYHLFFLVQSHCSKTDKQILIKESFEGKLSNDYICECIWLDKKLTREWLWGVSWKFLWNTFALSWLKIIFCESHIGSETPLREEGKSR